MLGLSPDQMGHLVHAGLSTILLANCAAFMWLHRNRYTLRGMIRKLRSYL